MPVNKDALSRYRWIDERLRNKRLPHPTLQDLIDFVSEKMDKTIPLRTIQKDLHDMRYSAELNYKAPIYYDRAQKVYYYEEPDYSISNMPVSDYDLQGLEIAISILEQFKSLPVIKQFEDAILKIAASLKINREKLENKNIIKLDAPAQYKGLEWISDIVDAMKSHTMVRLAYQSFERNEPKEHWVEPYHLREYQNRFYLIGKSLNTKEGKILTFGLDRIVNLWPTNKTFDEKNFDQADYFKHVLGISAPELTPEKIILSFSPQQAKYIISQPLHTSQVIIKNNEKECRISIELVVNFELIRLLLGYGSSVKIISPKNLAERIINEAEKVVQLYTR
jgi:predicted DNA-binding transcriptional regulator YafY